MKKMFILLLLLFVSLSFVSAKDVIREFNSNPDMELFNFPYWVGTGETGILYVNNVDEVTTNYATIYLGDFVSKLMYYPVNASLMVGTNVSGGLDSLLLVDGVNWTFDEIVANPGAVAQINYSVLNGWNHIDMRVGYDGSDAHIFTLQAFNYTSGSWRNIIDIPNTNGVITSFEVNLSDAQEDFNRSNGLVQLRLYHEQGLASHRIYLDYLLIERTGCCGVNMTYLPSDNRFRSYVTSASEEDVLFTVEVYDNTSTLLERGNDTLRFRNDFDTEFVLYKNTNLSGMDLERYDNEFQYVLLRYKDTGDIIYSYELETSGYGSILNTIGGFFPYYQDLETTETIKKTNDIYLYGRVIDGIATVKTYQNGTYDIYLINTDYYGALSNLYEFAEPIPNNNFEFKSNLIGDFEIRNETAQSWSVHISTFEVFKYHLLKNILLIGLTLFLWSIAVLFLASVSVNIVNIPVDGTGKAFGVLIGTYGVATSWIPILIIRTILG